MYNREIAALQAGIVKPCIAFTGTFNNKMTTGQKADMKQAL